jgi:hypothetical protein
LANSFAASTVTYRWQSPRRSFGNRIPAIATTAGAATASTLLRGTAAPIEREIRDPTDNTQETNLVNTVHRVLLTLVLGALVAGCGGGSAEPPTPTISLLSSRADMVTDGSALVQVTMSGNAQISDVRVTVGANDVTAQFQRTSNISMIGIVTGLQLGHNAISASAGGRSGTLEVINSSRNGPVVSGPQQSPFLCTTDKFVLPDGSNLGLATDASCNAPTKVLYLYMPAGGTALKILSSTTQLPSDITQTTTNDGRTVNYIVRLETGTVNRAIYQIAVLFDPTKDTVPNAGGAFSGWNGKLIYSYGGGTGPGYFQGIFTGGVTSDYMLKKGFAVASSTLNVGLEASNDVISAETTSMVKEIFIKEFGVPLYTMGFGGSGGAIAQYLVAKNYPGLLDGINPSLAFPDVFTLFPPVQDCALLNRAFAASSLPWTDAQKNAVAGFASWRNCNAGQGTTFATDWQNSYNFLAAKLSVPSATGGFPNCFVAVIPSSMLYDPVTNPGGIRCGIFDGDKTLLGVDPGTGFAKRPWDNVGVQYGLQALTDGKISTEQFVQLNELTGGYDSDGNLQAARTAATADALNAAYAYGRVNQMQNLSTIPILDYRGYSETDPNVHDFVRSFVARARLTRSTGSALNQVIWAAPKSAPAPGPTPPQPVVDQVIAAMDQWLTAIKKDGASGTAAEKVVRNKPASLTDGCFNATNQFISEPLSVNNSGQCGALYPVHSDPRIVSGAPLTSDVLKCQLRPLQRTDYSGITDAQFGRLTATFPGGVCDYSKPGVGAVPLAGPWLKYIAPGMASPL